jgi:hypothetical protein
MLPAVHRLALARKDPLMAQHSPRSWLLLLGLLVGGAPGCKDPDPTFLFDGSASDGARNEAGGEDTAAGADAPGDAGSSDAPDGSSR